MTIDPVPEMTEQEQAICSRLLDKPNVLVADNIARHPNNRHLPPDMTVISVKYYSVRHLQPLWVEIPLSKVMVEDVISTDIIVNHVMQEIYAIEDGGPATISARAESSD